MHEALGDTRVVLVNGARQCGKSTLVQLIGSDERAELWHYRTRDKVAVDAVLENRRGQVVGIEVKASAPRTSGGFATSPTGWTTTSWSGSSSTPVSRRFPSVLDCGPCRSAPSGRPPHSDHRDG